ncbi:MAG: hypothetical protein ACE5JJ_01505 [Nitrospinota bacterium]
MAVSLSNRGDERLKSWALGYLAFSLLAATADWVAGLGLGRWSQGRLEPLGWPGGGLAFLQSLFLLALPGLLLL